MMMTKELHDPGGSLRSPPGLPGRWLFLVYLLLTGYLLFAHGCHGDEDNELFAWLAEAACRLAR